MKRVKKDFGKRILELMAGAGIKTAKELADRINAISLEKTNQNVVTPSSVGRWISGESQPKATSLMFLAQALNVSADLILFEANPVNEPQESLRKVVAEVAEVEVKRLLAEKKSDLEAELARFQKSKKIPLEDKEIILAQIKRLLERYEDLDSGRSDSESKPSDD